MAFSTGTTRIAMLSGPRNISTTIMRSFENRPDADVKDEPFYGWYLELTGALHPMREEIISAMPCKWERVIANLREESSPHPLQFEKHIAFHFVDAPDFNWLKDARVFHLIRDPRAMVASYKAKYDDVTPIAESYRIQRTLYEAEPAPVIDAQDVLRAPEAMLKALCKSLDIPFHKSMLSWPAGPRKSDGTWAPHWYDAVWSSTGFRPYREQEIQLPDDLERIAQASSADYRFFHERRLTPE